MDKPVTRRPQVSAYLVGLLVIVPITSVATTLVTVKVTVVSPPACVINDNRPIAVDFGEVMTTRVDGHNYRMPVKYTLSCSGTSSSNAMKMQVQGNSASFDGSILRTNKNFLGIELQLGTGKLPVNSWLNFTYPNKPELWAVPVKQSGTTLAGGEFTAGATMKVAYQ